MKGIILAGGSGTRLYPVTLGVCKQLLPVYDKPMIYYPLSVLMQAGIREILIISTPQDLPRFQELFQDGSHLGLCICYQEQEKPEGLAQAFLIGADFCKNEPVALILGDNIFYGQDLHQMLISGMNLQKGGLIFGYQVKNPSRYGVVSFNEEQRVIDIEEKPKEPKSNFAVPGLYFYGPDVAEVAKSLTPSKRGELEITDLNRVYLKRKELFVHFIEKGHAWLDMGTVEDLASASSFVKAIQERQGIKIGCIEEIAYQRGYIEKEDLLRLSRQYSNEYGQYLEKVAFSQKFSNDFVLR